MARVGSDCAAAGELLLRGETDLRGDSDAAAAGLGRAPFGAAADSALRRSRVPLPFLQPREPRLTHHFAARGLHCGLAPQRGEVLHAVRGQLQLRRCLHSHSSPHRPRPQPAEPSEVPQRGKEEQTAEGILVGAGRVHLRGSHLRERGRGDEFSAADQRGVRGHRFDAGTREHRSDGSDPSTLRRLRSDRGETQTVAGRVQRDANLQQSVGSGISVGVFLLGTDCWVFAGVLWRVGVRPLFGWLFGYGPFHLDSFLKALRKERTQIQSAAEPNNFRSYSTPLFLH